MVEKIVDAFQGDIKILGESLSASANTENESSLPRLRQVREIWNSYQTDPSLKPSWVPEEALRFLMVSAVIGTLDQLDSYDPRMAEVVIRYFMTKETLDDMKLVTEVSSNAAVLYVVRKGIERLWNKMPNKGDIVSNLHNIPFPLDKTVEFPAESLHRNHSEIRREVAKALWEGPEARTAQRRAIRKGMAQVHDKLSAAQLRRWERQRIEDENSVDSN